MSTRRRAVGFAVVAGVVLATLAGAQPVGAQAERMRLECDTGLVIERSNGSSWWGLASDGSRDGSVYTTRHLKVVDADGNVAYEHHYGHKSERLDSTTCVASHFGSTWTVELVRAS